MREIDPAKTLSDIVLFYGASDVQLSGILLKVYNPKLTVIRGVENTLLLFFNDGSKIPIVNQMISSHKIIYNIFGSGIYHKPNSIKYIYIKSFTIKIGLFSVNDTRMDIYFMGMHRDLRV